MYRGFLLKKEAYKGIIFKKEFFCSKSGPPSSLFLSRPSCAASIAMEEDNIFDFVI